MQSFDEVLASTLTATERHLYFRHIECAHSLDTLIDEFQTTLGDLSMAWLRIENKLRQAFRP